MRSIGIDIGRYSIKVVEILASNRSYTITNAKEYVILNPQTNDQEIDILQTLKQISEEFDTDSARVTGSVRQQYISSRKLFFPFKERVKIQKSLAFELEDDIPLAIEKAVYDSKIIRFHDKSTEVVAMACVSEEVEKTLELFNRSHIDPDIIAPEFSALANLFEQWDKPPQQVKGGQPEITEITEDNTRVISQDRMILQIGHSKSFIGVVSDDHLIWGRSVLWGAEKIAQAISQTFQVPFMTALQMMPEKAFLLMTHEGANSDQIKMSKAVAEAFNPLLQSVRLSMMLANTEYGANITHVEVMGGASKIKNLSAYFTQELDAATNVFNPMANLDVHNIRSHMGLDDVFQIATGLAIEGLRRPFNPPVNFRQEQFAKKNKSFERFWDKWGYSLKVAGMAYLFFIIYSLAIDAVSTRLESKSFEVMFEQAGKIANLKGSGIERKVRQFINDNNKKAQVVGYFEDLDEIVGPVDIINKISQILPPNEKDLGFDVRRLIINDDKVDIQGVAKDQKIIGSIEKALKALAVGGKVTAAAATIKPEADKKPFAYNFKVRRKN